MPEILFRVTYKDGLTKETLLSFLETVEGPCIVNHEYPHGNYHSHVYIQTPKLTSANLRDRFRRFTKITAEQNKSSRLFSFADAGGTFEQIMSYIYKGPHAEKVTPNSRYYKLSSRLEFDSTEILFERDITYDLPTIAYYKQFWETHGEVTSTIDVRDKECKRKLSKPWMDVLVEEFDKELKLRRDLLDMNPESSEITTIHINEMYDFILERLGSANRGFDDTIILRTMNLLLQKYHPYIKDGDRYRRQQKERIISKFTAY